MGEKCQLKCSLLHRNNALSLLCYLTLLMGVSAFPSRLYSSNILPTETAQGALTQARFKHIFSDRIHRTCVPRRMNLHGSNVREPSELRNASPLESDIANAAEIEENVYKSAIVTTLGWVGAAVLFDVFLYVTMGVTASEEFFAGYLVEQSLSVDNIFVFLLLFDYFRVPLPSQNRVLKWGIIGAFVMRGVMIGIGTAALQNFHEILLVFAAILVLSSGKILIAGDEDDEEEDPGDNAIVKFASSMFESSSKFDGDNFFTVEDGIKKATPLFICLIALELSDVVFAVDSIPAVFGVTENPLIVFTSNLFAIMGLRSLYTILSKAASDLKYLEPAVAVVLGFIGSKMIAEYFGYCIATPIALGVVATMLGVGVLASIAEKRQTLQ